MTTAVGTKEDLAQMLERFSGQSEKHCGPYEYDDFTSVPNSNPQLESYRKRILREVEPLLGKGPVQQLDDHIASIIHDLRQHAQD